MNVKFSHKLAIAKRRQEVAELSLEGFSQTAIAEKLNLTQAAISKDLKQIRIAWRESSIRDFEEIRSQELAKLDMIEREAWAAWRRSQQPAQTATVDGPARFPEGQADGAASVWGSTVLADHLGSH